MCDIDYNREMGDIIERDVYYLIDVNEKQDSRRQTTKATLKVKNYVSALTSIAIAFVFEYIGLIFKIFELMSCEYFMVLSKHFSIHMGFCLLLRSSCLFRLSLFEYASRYSH